MKTYSAKPGEVARDWYVVDAEGRHWPLRDADRRRLARQEGRPIRLTDTGDFVVVVNAEKIAVTGQKLDQRYHRHSGYPGGFPHPHAAHAAGVAADRGAAQGGQGDVSRNRLARQQITKLKIYAGPTHPHEGPGAQDVGGLVVAEQAQYLGTGKRKTSVARVILRPGDGKTWFNGRTPSRTTSRA